MGIVIDDGRGRGNAAGVSLTGNRLDVSSRSDARIYYISRDNGDAYTWSSGTYDAAAGDTILLVKNTSTTQRLHIKKISLSADVESRVVIHVPTSEVTPTGTAITGVNLNSTSGNSAAATAIRDETNNSQGNILWSGEIQAAIAPYEVNFEDAVILGQNDSIGVDYVADAGACDVVITGFYETD